MAEKIENIGTSNEHRTEVESGIRFAFGENWSAFLRDINKERISLAVSSLQTALGRKSLQGLSFLDVGCGSGLFSLAAAQLGARVHSFDYDPASVACAKTLRERYMPDNQNWSIEAGSVLDDEYLRKVAGAWDIVYSWGVLHHTGRMWSAINNVIPLVAPNGSLFIAIYNDQGWKSHVWHGVKVAFNKLPSWLAVPLATLLIVIPLQSAMLVKHLFKGKLRAYVRSLANYSASSLRGMSWWRDQIDWLGGLPFEVATPERLATHVEAHGFRTVWERRTQSLGCNEFVFTRQT
jgi:2-polyprenyl-3-methyl-5-hydroxy-6-metoxy-1,4-benzoquinol methylase